MTKDDVLLKFKEVIGDRNDDTVIAFLDAFDEYSAEIPDITEYEHKVKEVEDYWRKKYADRFFEKEEVKEYRDDYRKEDVYIRDEVKTPEDIIEDLFEERENN